MKFVVSSFCGGADSGCGCVRFGRRDDGGVTLKDEHGGEVKYDRGEWDAFVKGVQNNEFNAEPATAGV